MISSIAWVPAGVAAPVPRKYEMSATERELVRLMETQGSVVDELVAHRAESHSTKKKKEPNSKSSSLMPVSIHGLPADLRMDDYSSDEGGDDEGFGAGRLLVKGDEEQSGDADEDQSSDDEMDEEEGRSIDREDQEAESSDDDDDLADVPDTREYVPVDVEGLEAMGLSQIGGVGMKHGSAYLEDEEDDGSDVEDVQLTEDDAIILVAKTEEDYASLEVHVYDRKTGNLYVHHDIPLPSFPLCLAHGQVSCEASAGNFCAIGTFSPGIEIWNLDVLNALEPSCILGGEDTSAADDIMKLKILGGSKSSSKFSKLKNNTWRPGSHNDAVMALSWNSIHKQVIASGSADKNVKLWDVTKALGDDCNAATFTHHRDKVQSVEWHPKESTLLATGSFDRTVALLDARSNGRDVKKVKISSDCESIAWDALHPEFLTVASEDGTVTCWDVRKFETISPAWTMVANEFGGVSDITYNSHVKGMLATCSVDKTVRLWDVYSNGQSQAHQGAPASCGSKDMCSGKLYTVSFYPSSPWLLGCGGSGNQLALWDLSEEDAVQKRFGKRLSTCNADSDTPRVDEGDLDAMLSSTDQRVDSPDNRKNPDHKPKKKSKGKRSARKKGK